MLDLRVLRDNFKTIADALKKRGKEIPLEAVMKLDEERRAMMTKVEELKAKRNKISKEIPSMKKKGEDLSLIHIFRSPTGKTTFFQACGVYA